MTPDTDAAEWLDAADEEVRWVGRPDLYPVVPFVVIAVGVGLFGVLLATFVPSAAGSGPVGFVLIGFFIGIGLFVVGWRLRQRRRVRYAITTEAVHERTGTSAADVSTIPLAAIESSSVDQPVLAGVVDRGTVRIYAPTTDRTTLTLDGISRPNEVRALLTARREASDTGRVPAGTGSGSDVRNTPDTEGTATVGADDGVDPERGRAVSVPLRTDHDGRDDHGDEGRDEGSERSETVEGSGTGNDGEGDDEDQFVWGDSPSRDEQRSASGIDEGDDDSDGDADAGVDNTDSTDGTGGADDRS
jgi:hypothetical protein